MTEPMEYFFFCCSLVVSSFYSGSEAALVSIPLDRSKQLIEEGGFKGRAIEFMASKPNQLLSTILIGNNVANIFAASLTTRLASRYFDNDALAISVGVTTVLILIFGEIIPKTFARSKSEALAAPIIRILQVNYYLIWPAVEGFTFIIQKVLGENSNLTGRLITRSDIEFMVNKAEKEQTIDSKDIDLLTSILEFPSIRVRDIMIPRNNVQYISHDLKLEDVLKVVDEDNYSRYPVCVDGNLDKVIGFLHVKDLAFILPEERANFKLQNIMKDPFFVYEHMKIQAVFDHMNKKKVHLALVKDENGLVVGIITLEDIIEEILGEIHDEHDDEENNELKKEVLPGGGLIISGQVNIRDLNSEYDFNLELSDNYSTLAGFLLEKLGNNFPKHGNIIIWEDISFELIKVVNHEIKEVKITSANGNPHLTKKAP